MSATTCRRCGHDAAAHPRVGVKDHAEPVRWVTECGDCEVEGLYCPALLLPGDDPDVEVLDAVIVDPIEDRLRGALVVAGLAGGVAAVLLLTAAFVVGIVARWQVDERVKGALDGTAVLLVLAAAFAGVLSSGAVRYGIGQPVDVEPVDEPEAPADPGVSERGDGAR